MNVINWTGMNEIDEALDRGETRGRFDAGTVGGKWWVNDEGEIEIKNTWYDFDWENAEPVTDAEMKKLCGRMCLEHFSNLVGRFLGNDNDEDDGDAPRTGCHE